MWHSSIVVQKGQPTKKAPMTSTKSAKIWRCGRFRILNRLLNIETIHKNRYVRKMGMNLLSSVCRERVHKKICFREKFLWTEKWAWVKLEFYFILNLYSYNWNNCHSRAKKFNKNCSKSIPAGWCWGCRQGPWCPPEWPQTGQPLHLGPA